MIRNAKALGLALAALLAMSAVVASAASAQGVLTASQPVTLTGTETGPPEANQMVMFGVAFRCPGSIYTGHKYNATPHALIASGETTVTLTPKYKICTVPSLGWSATIDLNSCDIVAHLGATTGGAGTYAVTLDVVCPVGNAIEITVWTNETNHINQPSMLLCALAIPSQSGIAGAHATNTTGGHIALHGTGTGITATKTANPSHPLLCAHSTTNTASFALDVTFSGENVGPVAISISD